MMELGRVVDASGAGLDRAMAVRFAAPDSYTGEEMVELHCHGSRLVLSRTLGLLLAAGAREARPGEFTQRAFLNGKMDLTQAEAVADLIAAHSDRALLLANRHLAGLFGRKVDALYRQAGQQLSEAEARLDFPEEELALTPPEALCADAAALNSELEKLLAGRRQGEIMRGGIRVVLAGPPNAGKSSLLNAILGRDRAIVTPLPGTTRDTLEEWTGIRGLPVCFVDTAGIRETHDEVETDGIRRAHEARAAADVELWIMDATRPPEGEIENLKLEIGKEEKAQGGRIVIPVVNKSDLLAAGSPASSQTLQHHSLTALQSTVAPSYRPPAPQVFVSAKTGAGLEELFRRIEEAVLPKTDGDAEIAVNGRHAALLEQALAEVAEAAAEMRLGRWELAAVAWRGVLDALGRITGKTHSPDVLDSIFSRFCIGK
jgi:tRNA modification GTPase